ncbi:protein DEPP1 [Bombina bombina]|uniref:protein DEPP1 n=1 Tax=Bombina bombina TaxID=8345 RepID=UPI00235AF586|nr:protein DEPP1 [Bombina bombina]
MRSQLLISVAQLPTISEDAETKTQGEGSGVDTDMTNGLEEYVKSIQTLAQPSSFSMDLVQPGQSKNLRRTRMRNRSSLRGCEGRVLTAAQDATSPVLQVDADPLAWLYRQNGKENQDIQEASSSHRNAFSRSLCPASHLNLFKTADTLKRQPSGKDQNSALQRAQEKRNKIRLQKKSRSLSCSNRVANKLQKPQLPVIYEL